MPAQECIDVEIYVDGQPLKEYINPDSENEDDHHMTRYVEVKAGQKFSVKATILPGFKFYSANHIYVKLEVDQEQSYEQDWCSYESAGAHGGRIRQPVVFWFDTSPMKDDSTGRWVNSQYIFGALAVDENGPLPEDSSLSAVDLLGSIRVSIYRTKAIKRDQPYRWHGNLAKPLDEISERALKGKAIKNNVKFNVTGAAEAPPPQYYDYITINGDRGIPYEFRFLYRNRKILQSLGCIERSPSPPPDAALIMQRNNETIQMMKQELTELRDRVARAESGSRAGSVSEHDSNATVLVPSREPSVKAEPNLEPMASSRRPREIKTEARPSIPPPPLFTNVKQEKGTSGHNNQTSRGVKRSREEAMFDDGDDLLEVAPPPRKPKIVVDLTDD